MFSFFLFIFHFCFAAEASDATLASSPPSAHAYFFDVGQGHCFFFATADKKFAILIDAGSTVNPQDAITTTEITKAQTCGNIKATIKNYIDRGTKFLIITTHGDIDHYNLIEGILPKDKKNTCARLCVLGGKPKDYDSLLLPSFMPQSTSGSATTCEIHFCENMDKRTINKRIDKFLLDSVDNGSNDDKPPVRNSCLSAQILSIGPQITSTDNAVPSSMETSVEEDEEDTPVATSIPPRKRKDEDDRKNRNSLVIRIEYTVPHSGKKVSFMIPGDAPEVITDQIIREYNKGECVVNHTTGAITVNRPVEVLQSTVLLASHHGSAENGANNTAWLRAVNPKYVVFSHGISKGFRHPHSDAVVDACRITAQHGPSPNPHILFYGFPGSIDLPLINLPDINTQTFAVLDNRYSMLLTSCNVMSTHTQGDIMFEINNTGIKTPICTKEIIGIASSSMIMKQYLFTESGNRNNRVLTPNSNIVYLDFLGYLELATIFLGNPNIAGTYMLNLRTVNFGGISFTDDLIEALEDLKRRFPKSVVWTNTLVLPTVSQSSSSNTADEDA